MLRISVAFNVVLALVVLAACVWKFTDIRVYLQNLAGGSYEENTLYEPYVYQASELSGVTECDVCMVGDSLTMHGFWDEFWPDLEVVNRGIGNDISEGLLARVDTIISCSPKKVFVMIGTNDVARMISEDVTVDNVSSFIEQLLDELDGVEIYVQSVLPRTSKYTSQVESFNVALEEMVSEWGDQVRFVDLYSLYVNADGTINSDLFALDGYHMSGEGYQVWENAIRTYVY